MRSRALYIIGLLLISTSMVVASEGGDHHGFPAKALATHFINLLIVGGVIAWALFSKVGIKKAAVDSRKAMKDEIIAAENELKKAQEKQSTLETKLKNIQQESEMVLLRAQDQAKKIVQGIKTEAEQLAQKIIEDAETTAKLELNRVKEKVAEEIVELAMQKAAQTIQTSLKENKDAEVISDRLKNMGVN